MRTKRPCYFLSVCLLALYCSNAFSQARLVLGNTSAVYMVMNSNSVVGGNPIYLVVGDAATSAASNTITRNTGWIISEGENNILKWHIGTNTGIYNVPWGYSTTDYIPLVVNKTSAGSVAGAYFQFATYRTGWQNSAMKPAAVTNVTSQPCNCDGSPKMVDRFWKIDARTGYTTLPNTDITFTYVDGGGTNPEVTTTGNTLNEADLQAQRYNSSANSWQGALFGTDNTASNNVAATGINGNSDLYIWWTLVDKFAPLPVTWLDLTAGCDKQEMIIKWSTASEQNADYFTVERSTDGVVFSPLAQVPASGNSTTVKNYSYTDIDAPNVTSYYRVRETDYNGEFSFSSQVLVNGCGTKNEMGVYPNPSLGAFNVSITGAKDEEVVIVVVDMLGREFYSKVTLLSGDHEVIAIDAADQLAAGVYTIIATSKDEIIKKKIVIQ